MRGDVAGNAGRCERIAEGEEAEVGDFQIACEGRGGAAGTERKKRFEIVVDNVG